MGDTTPLCRLAWTFSVNVKSRNNNRWDLLVNRAAPYRRDGGPSCTAAGMQMLVLESGTCGVHALVSCNHPRIIMGARMC